MEEIKKLSKIENRSKIEDTSYITALEINNEQLKAENEELKKEVEEAEIMATKFAKLAKDRKQKNQRLKEAIEEGINWLYECNQEKNYAQTIKALKSILQKALEE